MGCPIRTPRDQRPLAAPPRFSQRATSFIASWCQGIHQMPFSYSHPAKQPSNTDHSTSKQPPRFLKTSPCTGTIHTPKSRRRPVPDPTTKPLTQHTLFNVLDTATRMKLPLQPEFALGAKHSLRRTQPPGQTTHANPSRITPANPTQPLTQPDQTHRGVLRAQNAPEPDSQSIKNKHTSGPERQTPPNGSGPAIETQTQTFP